MKFLKCLIYLTILIVCNNSFAQTPACSPNGNLLLFSNYDGGELNINVDQNIPNLKIGVCTYEPVRITISGAFASNVTQVLYAGFNSTQNNNNCNIGNFPTSIIGVPLSNQSILTSPPVTLNNPNGFNFGIVCGYSCDVNTNQGGCNTIDQIEDYFMTQLGGTLYSLNAQYCCWLGSDTFQVSQLAGSCCISSIGSLTLTSAIGSDSQTVCINNPITNITYGYTTATPTLSGLPNGLNSTINNGIVTISGTPTIVGAFIYNLSIPGNCNNVQTITGTIIVDNFIRDTIVANACASYTSPWGISYNQTGIYEDTIMNSSGCDSIISLNLTILGTVTTPTLTVSACSPYTAPWGTVYTQSGTYSATLTSVNGCDSIVSVNLTITGAIITPPLTANACGAYTSPWGTVYTQSGMYSDTLTSVNGCDSIVSVNLTITGSPTVTASSVQNPLGLPGLETFFCAGSGGVGINSLGSGGVAPYSYEWLPNNGSLSDAFIANPNANPDSTTVYQVWVTDASGCRSPQPGSVTVQVIALPSVDAGADTEFCADAPGVFLSGQVLNPQSGGYRWRWIPATGLFCDTCATTYANPAVSTLYTLYASHIPSGCNSDSTTLNSLSTVAITVKPRPIVYGGLDTTLCQSDSALLCATATGAGPLYTYEWSPALGVNDSVLQCPSVSAPHTIDYFVVVTSNGCESVADTVRITIVPVPTVDAGNTGNICVGDSLRLQGQVQQGLNVQFRWRPSLALSDSTILQPQASPTATSWYYLRSFHSGCGGIEDSVLVIVHPVPMVDAGADTLLCGDSTLIQLQGTYSGVPAPVQINWHPNVSQSLTPWVRPAETTLYTLSVSSGIGISQCVAEDSVLITVLPIPEFALYADTTTVCSGDSIQVQAVSVLSGGLTWSWSPAPGVSGTSSNWHILPDQSGTYVLTSTAGQCSYADSLNLVVHPVVQAEFTMSQPELCGSGIVQFQNLSQNGLHYLWYFGDSSGVDNTLNPRYEYASAGTYPVVLHVYGIGGCHDSVMGSLPVQIHPEYTPEVITQPLTPLELYLPAGTISVSENSKSSVRWHWDFGDGSYHQELSQASHRYIRPGTYTVRLRSEDVNGCAGHWMSEPITIREPSVFIPNVFSPNADGVGDVFQIGYDGNESFYLEILDRWGVKQFETRNASQHWDGRNLQGAEVSLGVYFYVLRIGAQKWQGDVTVVR